MRYGVEFRAGERNRDERGRPTDDPRSYWTEDHWVVIDLDAPTFRRWADGRAWPTREVAEARAAEMEASL